MSKTVLQTDSDFQKLVVGASHHQPVVALFSAPWCAPCRVMKPDLEALSTERDFPLVEIDAEAHKQISRTLQIRSVPTVIVYSRGKEITRFSGLKSKDTLLAALGRTGAFQQAAL